ncbi:dnaJ homolog subfamily C member 9-like [Saccostrea echinata]|uniref:dnaJ homolog subfamily C member 9-like n=1 Tax=Saccostrea echinata TaxID=191078 RepID=UPI002A7F1DD1|nr:dnaJ homolog subfamily C member 9-like [Saccostrea echinata]
MPSLLESCQELFGTDNLYEILGIEKDSSNKDVKKGYHKVSLKVHPDRVHTEKKEEATKKFQTLGRIYSILSDKDKRAVYDETGDVEDEDIVQQDRDWSDYWRLLFKKVTEEDIKSFQKEYKDSEEELEDLKTAYIECEGDMDGIIDSVMCATIEDEARFTKILKQLIRKKEIPDFPAFSKEGKKKKAERKRKHEAEAAEAEIEAKKIGLDNDKSLKALIQKKQQTREQAADDFFSQLEAKYTKPKKNNTKGKVKK